MRHKHNVARIQDLCHSGEDHLADYDADSILALSAELSRAAPYGGPTTWVHGDAYPCHYLANDQHEVCGVIDWGDAHLGDPALDIQIAFSFLPPEARGKFRKTYGDLDEDTWRRAQFRALHYGLLFVKYGLETGKLEMKQLGLDILRFTLA